MKEVRLIIIENLPKYEKILLTQKKNIYLFFTNLIYDNHFFTKLKS
jgi:hypothetical protein